MDINIVLLSEYIGIASAALSGFYFGVAKKCDFLGIFISSFLTALGGGILRDITVGRPLYSFTHYMPCSIVIAVMTLAIILKLHKNDRIKTHAAFVFTDAIDVVAFSIVGSIVAIEYDYNVFGVIAIGFINGVCGGLLRDIILNEVPWFLLSGLYGSVAILISAIYYVLHLIGIADNIVTFMCLLSFGIAFRMLAYYRKWNLGTLE